MARSKQSHRERIVRELTSQRPQPRPSSQRASSVPLTSQKKEKSRKSKKSRQTQEVFVEVNTHDSDETAVQRENQVESPNDFLMDDILDHNPLNIETVDPHLTNATYNHNSGTEEEQEQGQEQERDSDEAVVEAENANSESSDEERQLSHWSRSDKAQWYDYYVKVNKGIGNKTFKIEDIIRWRYHPRKETFIQYRVKWEGYRDWTNSWEPAPNFGKSRAKIDGFWRKERDNGRARPDISYKKKENEVDPEAFEMESDDTYSELWSDDQKKRKAASQKHIQDVREDRFVLQAERNNTLAQNGVPLFNMSKKKKKAITNTKRPQLEMATPEFDEEDDLYMNNDVVSYVAGMICGRPSQNDRRSLHERTSNAHAVQSGSGSSPSRLRSGAIRSQQARKSSGKSRRSGNERENGNNHVGIETEEEDEDGADAPIDPVEKQRKLEYARTFMTTSTKRGRKATHHQNGENVPEGSEAIPNPHRPSRVLTPSNVQHAWKGAHKDQGRIKILQPAGLSRMANGNVEGADASMENDLNMADDNANDQNTSAVNKGDDSGLYVNDEEDEVMKEVSDGDEEANSPHHEQENTDGVHTPPFPPPPTSSEGEVAADLDEGEVWNSFQAFMQQH